MSAPNIKQVCTQALENVAQQEEMVFGTAIDLVPRIRGTLPTLEYIFNHAEVLGPIMNEVNYILEHTESRVSPSTKRKRRAADAKWIAIVNHYEPDLPPDSVWNVETVKKYYKYMLPLLLNGAKGSKGRRRIKSSTLEGFKELFVWSIAKHTTDSEGNHCGSVLLSKGGMLTELEDQVFSLINSYGLDRTQDTKFYYSELELKLVVQEYIKMSNNSGRLATLQKLCIVLTLFYTSLRPGSLGPSHHDYEVQGKYPKLRNLKIFRLGFMTFKVEFTVENFKANNNTVNALSRKYVFQPVVQWCNVHLDLSLYFVAFLLARGALEGISTIDDLRNSSLVNVKIKESMKDEPLFLAFQEGGKSFSDDKRPVTANGINGLIKVVTSNAGLAEGTAYCFRRGAANDYEIILGKEFAEHLLTHASPGSLHFYSENTANIDVVGARLNELPIPMDANKQYFLNSRIPTSPAVRAVTYLFKTKESNSSQGNDTAKGSSLEKDKDSVHVKSPRNERSQVIGLTYDEKIELQMGNEECRNLSSQLEHKWKQFMACYPPVTQSARKNREYKMTQTNINIIKKRFAGECLVSVEAAAKAEQELRDAFGIEQASRKKLYRNAKRDRMKEHQRGRQAGLDDGVTTDDVSDAIQNLMEETPLIMERPGFVPPRPFGAQSTNLADLRQNSNARSVMETVQLEAASRHASSSQVSPHDITIPWSRSRASVAFPTLPSLPRSLPNTMSMASGSIPPSQVAHQIHSEGDGILCDLDSDEEPDTALTVFSRNLRNSIPKRLKNSKKKNHSQLMTSASNDDRDLDLPPCSITDIESSIVDDSKVKTADVRSAYIETLIAPIVIESAFQNLQPNDSGRYKCPRCEEHFHHRPDLQAATFYSTAKVRRHVTTQHTAWKELALLMIKNGDVKKYYCPLAPSCNFIGKNEKEVRKHCRKNCTGKKVFAAMLEEHNSLVDDCRTARKKSVSHEEFSSHKDRVFGPQQETENELLAYIHSISNTAYAEAVEDIHTIAKHEWSPAETCAYEELENDTIGRDLLCKLFDEYNIH